MKARQLIACHACTAVVQLRLLLALHTLQHTVQCIQIECIHMDTCRLPRLHCTLTRRRLQIDGLGIYSLLVAFPTASLHQWSAWAAASAITEPPAALAVGLIDR